MGLFSADIHYFQLMKEAHAEARFHQNSAWREHEQT